MHPLNTNHEYVPNSTWPGVDRDKGLEGLVVFFVSETKWKLTTVLSAKIQGLGIFDLIELMKPHRRSAPKVTLLGEKVREGDILKGVCYWNGTSKLIMNDFRVEKNRRMVNDH